MMICQQDISQIILLMRSGNMDNEIIKTKLIRGSVDSYWIIFVSKFK